MITNKMIYLLFKLSFMNVYAEGVADNFCTDFGNTFISFDSSLFAIIFE